MIAHYGARRAGLDHVAYQLERSQLTGPAINEVADEDRRPARVSPRAASVLVAQLLEKRSQLVGVTMDIADDVVVHQGNLTAWARNASALARLAASPT